MRKKRLPVITCADCAFRGRGRIESSVEIAHGGHASGVIVSVQGERVKLFCPACGGFETSLAKSAPKGETT